MNHTNTGLVAHGQGMLGQPYWYGTCCYPCTTSLLTRKAAQYPSHYTQGRMARYRDDIAKGRTAGDCVGIIKGYYWLNDEGKQVYVAATDVNTTGMYNKATIKGPIHTMPEVPGVIVYMSGHVGIYEGDGWVIEAKGFASGVVRTRLEDGKWTHWLACPFISYAGYEEKLLPEPFTGAYEALVTTSKDPLNIWDSPAKGNSRLQVAKGDTLMVTGYGSALGWYEVYKYDEKKGRVHGEADGKFLTRIDSPVLPEEETDAGDADPAFAPYRAEIIDVVKGLNLRTTPEMAEKNTILLIPPGAIVEVTAEGELFNTVRYAGKYGFATAAKMVALEVE